MNDQLDTSAFPDPHRVILPSRAYLLSVRDQTLPTRRRAIEDAEELYSELGRDDDQNARDMALLGLIGEAMQALEDLAYFGRGYENPLQGIAHYVTATIYSASTPTTFFQQLKKWDDDRLLVLAGLRVREPGGDILSMARAFEAEDQFTGEELAAIEEAEAATIKLVRGYLIELARIWDQFFRYFHAYKHGGLAVNRDDCRLLDNDGNPQTASIAVWWRRKEEPQVHADTNLTSDQVAEAIAQAGRLALEISGFLVESRLRVLQLIRLDDAGRIVGVEDPRELWGFWFHGEDLSSHARGVLERRLGIAFTAL